MNLQSRAATVSGTVRAPPSKSYTHRAFLLAALSGGPCLVSRPLLSEDTEATLAGIEAFGAEVRRKGEEVRIASEGLAPPAKEIDARNSGTTLRLLTGTAALLPGTTTLTGDASLRKRPMGPLLEALRALGADGRSIGDDGRPPVRVTGPFRGGEASISGAVSSQFLSSLLLACPLAPGDTTIHVLPPVVSEPYVDITRHMLRIFRAAVEVRGNDFRIPGRQRYRPADFPVPGDFSSAAFPLAAAAISRGDVTVDGLDLAAPQGDRKIADLLETFGASVTQSARAIRVRGDSLRAQTVDVGATPDLFPVLAVLASQAHGETRFVNGAQLHLKESDRIETTVAFLRALGGEATGTPDGCVVRGPAELHGGRVDSHGDHRILMAAAVAGLAASGPVEITDPWCFRVSYPSFLDDFRALGAEMEVVP